MLPEKTDFFLKPEQFLLIGELVEELQDLFHANGSGLPRTFLTKGAAGFIRGFIGLVQVDSASLIGLYKDFLQQEHAQPVPIVFNRKNLSLTSHHLLYLLSTRRDDKVVKKFFDAMKAAEAEK